MSVIFCSRRQASEFVVHLAGAHQDTPHLFRVDLVDLADDVLPLAGGKFVERRDRLLVPQQALRASSRSAACATCATSAGAAGGRSGPAWTARRPACCARRTAAGSARDAPTSAPGPGLRSRAAATASGRTCGPTSTSPAADELVDHHLRAVGEIAELGFPDDELVRFRRGVAVLETEHRLFGQHRVDDFETRLVLLRCAAAGCSSQRPTCRGSGRAVPRGDARTCRGPRPGRTSRTAVCHRRAATRRRAFRPCPSRAASCPRPSRGDRP